MQGAHLWKRVLNEGLSGNDAEQWVSAIIRAPIIVDNRGGVPDKLALSGTGLGFPFEKFWLEGELANGEIASFGVWGALFGAKQRENGEGWDVRAFAVVGIPDMAPMLAGSFEFSADRLGNVVAGSEKVVPMRGGGGSRQSVNAAGATMAIQAISYDTLTLLGCKNVSLDPRVNDQNQVRRAVKRHGYTNHGYRYHVLVVRAAGAHSDAPSQEIGNMPRHICRGHFAEYGPEFSKGLLFGKYSGRFFVPPHLKGKSENGTIEKDYSVGGR